MKTLVLLSVLQCLIKCAGLASNCIRQGWLGDFFNIKNYVKGKKEEE